MRAELFTIGHSTHSTAHFIDLLKAHRINALCDVRSNPYSRHNPQHNRETLAAAIKNCGIQYVFLGKQLGARSGNPACYVNDKIQFEKLAAEPLFAQGLKRLKQGVDQYRIALMCAEKDPLTCHRTILVTRQLREQLVIKHILADGRIETNAAAETRLQNLLNIHPDLARSESQCIDDAYTLQGQKIAYVKARGEKL